MVAQRALRSGGKLPLERHGGNLAVEALSQQAAERALKKYPATATP